MRRIRLEMKRKVGKPVCTRLVHREETCSGQKSNHYVQWSEERAVSLDREI